MNATPMRKHEIEAWALRAIDQLTAHGVAEDSLVEFKREWPDPQQAARRIAGHANAARGEPVLWVIGVDEKAKQVTGATEVDFAAWWQQVQSHFNGVAPSHTSLNMVVSSLSVTAILFDSDRAPFVVKNPAFAQPGGGSVDLEVPWRDGTRIRSARREDLLRVLSPLAGIPDFQLVNAKLGASSDQLSGSHWHLTVDLFVSPRGTSPVVIPFFRCGLEWWLPKTSTKPIRHDADHFEIRGAQPFSAKGSPHPTNIRGTSSELCIDGAGMATVFARGTFRPVEIPPHSEQSEAAATLTLYCIEADRSICFDITLSVTEPQGTLGQWRLSHASMR